MGPKLGLKPPTGRGAMQQGGSHAVLAVMCCGTCLQLLSPRPFLVLLEDAVWVLVQSLAVTSCPLSPPTV